MDANFRHINKSVEIKISRFKILTEVYFRQFCEHQFYYTNFICFFKTFVIDYFVKKKVCYQLNIFYFIYKTQLNIMLTFILFNILVDT